MAYRSFLFSLHLFIYILKFVPYLEFNKFFHVLS